MQTPRPPRRKPGRPSLGDRTGTFVSLPVEIRGAAEVIAKAEGLPLSSVITRLLAEQLGLPVPAYCCPPASAQEELPLTHVS